MMIPSPQSSLLKINPYIPGESKLNTEKKIIRLASNENPLGASPKAKEAYLNVKNEFFRYPDAPSQTLRNTLAELYNLSSNQLICGNGSDELIYLLARSYAGEGDEIVFSQYGFAMYKIAALAAGATPIEVPAKENLQQDLDHILQKITPKTKLIYLANPNNPTGEMIDKKTIEDFHKNIPENVILVLDSAYSEYIDDPSYSSGMDLISNHSNIVMLRTFSKLYGLAGLRIGWAYGPLEIIDVLHRARSPFNVNLPAQTAAEAALSDYEFIERSKKINNSGLINLKEALENLDLIVYPSGGNFFLVEFPDNPKYTASQANDWLKNDGILVRPVGPYGLNNHLRITIGLDDEIDRLVLSLKDFLKS